MIWAFSLHPIALTCLLPCPFCSTPHPTTGFCYVNDIVLAILELLKYNQR